MKFSRTALLFLGIALAYSVSTTHKRFNGNQESLLQNTLSNSFNPWHEFSIGENAPRSVLAYIEITKGSRDKTAIDKETGELVLERVISDGLAYPANYGSIPKTYGGDTDPLDIFVFCSQDLKPRELTIARVLGVLKVIDNGDVDNKIISVCEHDPSYNGVNDYKSLSVDTLIDFYNSHQRPDGYTLEIKGFEDKESAYDVIESSIEKYTEVFPNNY